MTTWLCWMDLAFNQVWLTESFIFWDASMKLHSLANINWRFREPVTSSSAWCLLHTRCMPNLRLNPKDRHPVRLKCWLTFIRLQRVISQKTELLGHLFLKTGPKIIIKIMHLSIFQNRRSIRNSGFKANISLDIQ